MPLEWSAPGAGDTVKDIYTALINSDALTMPDGLRAFLHLHSLAKDLPQATTKTGVYMYDNYDEITSTCIRRILAMEPYHLKEIKDAR